MTKSNPANIDRESARSILAGLEEARLRTLELVADLDDRQLMGPQLKIVNPLRWEIGHVAFFQEFWCLRHFRGELPILKNGDQLYDSARVAHDTRWGLPLPSRRDTLDYMQRVLERVIELNKTETEKQIDGYGQHYFLQLALFHEQMHAEAIGYTRQTLEYPPPSFTTNPLPSLFEPSHDIIRGDAIIPGGRFVMGGNRRAGFVFDNEERDHEAFVEPFSMSRTAVTQAEFLAFVEDGGYRRPELWSEPGWAWRCAVSAECPVYWRRQSGANWSRRRFDEWVPLEDRLPVIHVNWYEADAYCRWSHRRLPTEAEWEMAATCEPASTDNELSPRKRVYAWGDEPPTITRANLDWRAMGCIAVDALPESDSAFGCRQMIGNCWEWTATDFAAYPGFKPGPYKEYSEPWFGDHKVLRGGCWTTRSSMIRSSYRNFYTPDRRDVWAGFRTCAV
jgi:iron(II)-dependent oxidoreductase